MRRLRIPGGILALVLASTVPTGHTTAAETVQRPQTAPSWSVTPKQAPPPVASTTTATISVDPQACRWVTGHRPSADVAYQPGVDVHGKPVAPADLPGSARIALPERLEIGVTVELAGRFGVPADALYGAEAYVGTVTVEGDRVLFNGTPLTPPAEAELVALCAQAKQP